jgi:hypothetical protein
LKKEFSIDRPMKWRVSYIGKTGQTLGTVEAPSEALACKEAIEFYDIPANQQFRVVAVKIEEAKKARVKRIEVV